MTSVNSLTNPRGGMASGPALFLQILPQDRKHMTRDEAAAKWKCSPGTIDKYAS